MSYIVILTSFIAIFPSMGYGLNESTSGGGLRSTQRNPRGMWTERRTQSELKLWLPIPIVLRVQSAAIFMRNVCQPRRYLEEKTIALINARGDQRLQLKLQGCHRN
jgi:hypothetical protein